MALETTASCVVLAQGLRHDEELLASKGLL
jgi:hypothetical protein